MATSKQNKASQDQARVELARMANSYKRIFSSDDGKQVLDDLRLRYGQASIHKDQHQMVVLASMRAVVDHIDHMIEVKIPDLSEVAA